MDRKVVRFRLFRFGPAVFPVCAGRRRVATCFARGWRKLAIMDLDSGAFEFLSRQVGQEKLNLRPREEKMWRTPVELRAVEAENTAVRPADENLLLLHNGGLRVPDPLPIHPFGRKKRHVEFPKFQAPLRRFPEQGGLQVQELPSQLEHLDTGNRSQDFTAGWT